MTSFVQAKEVKSGAYGIDEPSHRSNYGLSSVAFDLERGSRVDDKARTTISDQPNAYLPGTSRNYSPSQPMNSVYSPRGTLAVDETSTSAVGQSRFSSYAESRATTSGQRRTSDYTPRGTFPANEMRPSGQSQPSPYTESRTTEFDQLRPSDYRPTTASAAEDVRTFSQSKPSYTESRVTTSGQRRTSDYTPRGTSATVDEMRMSGQSQPSSYVEDRSTSFGHTRTSDFSPTATTLDEMRTSSQSKPSYDESRTTTSGQPKTSDYDATRGSIGNQTKTSTFDQPRTSSRAETRAASSSQPRTTMPGQPQEMANVDTQGNLEQVSHGTLSGDDRRRDSHGRHRSKDGQSSVSFVLETTRGASQVDQTAKASTSEQPKTSIPGQPKESTTDQPESTSSDQTEDKKASSITGRLSSDDSMETEVVKTVEQSTDEGQEDTKKVISTEDQSRDNELSVSQGPPISGPGQSSVDYVAPQKETQGTRFRRMERKPVVVGCPNGRVLPCKRFGRVFRDTQKCFDDLRGESSERFSCWSLVKNGASKSFNCMNSSKDFTVGWCREVEDKYRTLSTENNAKLSSSNLFSGCDAFPSVHVECPIHTFGSEKAGDADATERLNREEESDNFERLLEMTFSCNDEFAYDSFNCSTYSEDDDRCDCCFYGNDANKYTEPGM